MNPVFQYNIMSINPVVWSLNKYTSEIFRQSSSYPLKCLFAWKGTAIRRFLPLAFNLGSAKIVFTNFMTACIFIGISHNLGLANTIK